MKIPKRYAHKPRFGKGYQEGIILAVTMVFLLMLGMVAFSTTSKTLVSEKISGNQWEHDRAYQAAEAGLIDGSNWLFSLDDIEAPEGDGSGSVGIWQAASLSGKLYSDTYDWSDAIDYGDSTGASSSAFSALNGVPKYLIENVGWTADNASPEDASAGFITFYYGVSSVGYGAGEQSRVRLQTISAKRFR